MPQLKAYHRPSTLEEVLKLLSRPGVNSVVVAGGTYLTAHFSDRVDEVVDLQGLGLNEVTYQDNRLTLGAMVRLQAIVEDNRAPGLLRQVARQAGPSTLRQAATIGGVVVSADKDSELMAALLVFEAEVHVQSMHGSRAVPLPAFLRDIPAGLGGGIVTAVSLVTNGQTASARVARTPADSPIVAAVARREPGGRLFLALCGVASTPILVDPNNVKGAIHPQGDFRGSREYRRQMAAILSKRVIDELNQA